MPLVESGSTEFFNAVHKQPDYLRCLSPVAKPYDLKAALGEILQQSFDAQDGELAWLKTQFAELLKTKDEAKAKRFFDRLEDCLRPKNGRRLYGVNESDVSDLDKELLAYLREHWKECEIDEVVDTSSDSGSASPDLSKQEPKKVNFFGVLADFWFSENKPKELGLLEAIFSENQKNQKNENQQSILKLMYKLYSGVSVDKIKIKIKKPSRQQRLFYHLANRIAHINGDYIFSLNKFHDENHGDLGYSPALILHLHEIFWDIQALYRSNLIEEQEHYLSQLANFHGQGGNEDFLNYARYVISGSKDKAVLNGYRENLKNFRVEHLNYDLCVVRRRLKARKAEFDRQLALLCADTNRLAQELHVGLAVEAPTFKETLTLNFYDHGYTVQQPSLGLSAPSERKFRTLSNRANRLATFSAVMLGVGEGVVAAVGMYGVLVSILGPWAIPIAISTFIGGAIANYLLTKMDSYDTIMSFMQKVDAVMEDGSIQKVRKIYVDENGHMISKQLKFVVDVLTVCVVSAGFLYGALAACTMYKILLPALGQIFSIGLASLPVLFVAIGLGAIFYVVLLDFIKNKRWESIGNYFKNTYAPDYWSELSVLGKVSHVLLHIPFYAVKLIFGLALSGITTVCAFVLFHQSSTNLLTLFKCPEALASLISYVPTALNAVMATAFGIRKVQGSLAPLTPRVLVTLILDLPAIAYATIMLVLRLAVAVITSPLKFFGFIDQPWYAVLPWLDAPSRFWHEKVATPIGKCFVDETFCELTPLDPGKEDANLVQKANKGSIEAEHTIVKLAIWDNGIGQGLLFAKAIAESIAHYTGISFLVSGMIAFIATKTNSNVGNLSGAANAANDKQIAPCRMGPRLFSQGTFCAASQQVEKVLVA